MGLRFRRSIRVLPGIRINLSKSGVSTSLGVRGAHVTLGRSGVRTTVGLPGTGISYSTLHKAGHAPPPAPVDEPASSPGNARRGWLWLLLIVAALAWWALS